MTPPTLDLLVHNLIALCIGAAVLLVLSQIVAAGILRVSNRLLRTAMFKHLTEEERQAYRRQVRRNTLVTVAILGLLLLVGAVIASFTGHRALELAQAAWAQLRGETLTALLLRLPAAGGIILGGVIVDMLARALATAIGKAVSRSQIFPARQEPLSDVVKRLRAALRVTNLCIAAVLLVDALSLTPGQVLHAVTVCAYALGAFYVSRFMVRLAHLLVDLIFDMSDRLRKLDSPLKLLGGLQHMAGITKRTIEYFVYVGAATLVADVFTPDTWLARAGRVGIRVIAIFYMSRLLVEVCALFINEIFLGKIDEANRVSLQQRKTLVPVAMGLLRYGIYFSALIMVLREASIDPTPLLAGAGVLGVAVGLGSQAFVGDIVAGFFILFENLLLVGDLVEVSKVRGKVEEIGVRITKIRDDSGVLHSIPNGEVRKVSSHSKGFVNAVVDVYVPYEEDLRRVRTLLEDVAKRGLQEHTGSPGHVEIKVQELTEGSILLRVLARVPPGQDEDIADVLRALMVDALRSAKIGAPRPRKAVMIDSGIRVGSMAEGGEEEEETKAPGGPFQGPQTSG